jgi:hypothetical protein
MLAQWEREKKKKKKNGCFMKEEKIERQETFILLFPQNVSGLANRAHIFCPTLLLYDKSTAKSLTRAPPPPPPGRTRDKTALFSTRKKTSEKKFYFFFIEQIVISLRWTFQPLLNIWYFAETKHSIVRVWIGIERQKERWGRKNERKKKRMKSCFYMAA